MHGWLSDLRSGIRILTRSPGPATLGILVLALGIGLSAAMFSIVYGVVLRGLPIENSEQLMHLEATQVSQGGRPQLASLPQFLDWREQQASFAEMHAFRFEGVFVSGEGHPERLEGARITPGAFGHLGMAPVKGREFLSEDAELGAESVVILGYRVWRDRFSLDENVLGRTLRIDGHPATVVGVMADGFQFPNREEIWRPLTLDREGVARAEAPANLHVFGRLKDGADLATAQTDLASVQHRLGQAYPEAEGDLGVRITPYGRYFIGEEEISLSWTSLGAVSFVLLIACFNVANLLLARASGRSRELAMRAVLGAGRWRIIRQGLSESLVLSGIATLLGLGIASFLIQRFNTAVAGQEWPFWLDIGLDAQALVFVLFCTVTSACISGFIPAWRSSRLNIWGVLKDQSRGSRRSRLSQSLVIAEVALSCTLLVGAILMVRTLVNLATVDFQFDTENIYAGRVTLLSSNYPGWDELGTAWTEIERQLEEVSQVASAAVTDHAPGFEWASMKRYAVDGEVFDRIQAQPAARQVRVSPGFFETLGVGPLAGRLFKLGDRRETEPVVVVNRSFVQRHWPDGQAVGKTLRLGAASSNEPWRTVVGVVPDLHAGGPSDQNPVAFYIPMEQSMTRSAVLLVKTRVPGSEAVLPIRDAMAAFNSDIPVYFGGDLETKIGEQLFFYRMVGSIFGFMAFTALLLAATGLYGLLSFSVTQRLSELGVRVALGADTRQILSLIVRQGLKQVAWGLLLGLGLALVVARLLEHQLFGVSPFDPVTFLVVAIILLLVGFAAAFVPALRAGRVDPVVALRNE